MSSKHQDYQAYTLRLSRVADTGVWRATLYCAQTGQRHHFLDLAQLHAFLLRETSDSDGGPNSTSLPPGSANE